jgi:hypothetical protein
MAHLKQFYVVWSKIGFSIAVWGVANLNSGSENKVCQFWYRNEAM